MATPPFRPQNLHSALFYQISLEISLGILVVKLLPHLLQLALAEYGISIITIEAGYLSFFEIKTRIQYFFIILQEART